MWPSETLSRAVRSSSSGTTDPSDLTDPRDLTDAATWLTHRRLSWLRPARGCLDSGQRETVSTQASERKSFSIALVSMESAPSGSVRHCLRPLATMAVSYTHLPL